MSDINVARQVIADALKYFCCLVKKANNLALPTNSLMPCLLPEIDVDKLVNLQSEMETNNGPNFESKLFDYVKSDFGEVTANKGTIRFKTLAALLKPEEFKNYDSNKAEAGMRKYKPIKVFVYPRQDDPGKFADYGATLYWDIASFALFYDFTLPDCYLLRFIDVKLALEVSSWNSKTKESSRIFITPPIPMTVEIRIPRPLRFDVDFPAINLSFFGFSIDLDINFPSLNRNWSPLGLRFPDWLGWPFGPLDFNDIFGFNLNCKCDLGLAWPGGIKFRSPDISWPDWLVDWLKWLGFSFKGQPVDYFTYVKPADDSMIPEWAGIYFNLSGLCQAVLGGLAPKKMYLFLGIHQTGLVKAGFLACTGLGQKSLMFQTALDYQVVTKTEAGLELELEGHPGFVLEFLSDENLAKKVSCYPCTAAKLDFPGFSAQADRVAVEWDKALSSYVIFVDGKVTIHNLLKDSKDKKDLELPFKGLGFTPDGKLVLKKTWITLEQAVQIKIDDFDKVVLFLRSYGYGKETGEKFWVGFSGDLELPALGLKAGVDRLVIKQEGPPDLSGVRVDMDFQKGLTLKGALAWGEALKPPTLPVPTTTSTEGFGGQLLLGIKPIDLNLGLGMTYVRITAPPGKFLAWSFFLAVPLPVVVPLCFFLGLNAVGLMVGQNYLPQPKQKGLPTDRWLMEGFNGEVDNILDVMNYWTAEPDRFSAGFGVGLASTLDNGYIINGYAIMVLVVPGPVLMIAGKANILSRVNPNKSGAFELLIVYDQDDPGILASISYRYEVPYLLRIHGMAELYVSFTDVGDWHFYLGTPANPVTANVLTIFESKSYLTIDPCKVVVGSMVAYGNSWDWGPVSVKAYLSFAEEFQVSWNPVFIFITISFRGEARIRVFGFGLGLGLGGDLKVRAPDPWYLYAGVDLHFEIGFFFFSVSFDVHLDLEWGGNGAAPRPFLENLSRKESQLSLASSSVRAYVNLLPDKREGGIPCYYLPMDGVFGLQFLRDMQLDDKSPDFPILDAFVPVAINGEKCRYEASEFTEFRGKLTGFKVLKKDAPNHYSPVQRSIYFTWTPEDPAKRKKLIVRDFDQGCCQFRLNDDPNAHVKLTCPDFYQTDTPLICALEMQPPEKKGVFAALSPLALRCQPPQQIKVHLTKSPGDFFTLNYPDYQVLVARDPAVQLKKEAFLSIILATGTEFRFGRPAAAVAFTVILAQQPGGPPNAADYFRLLDDTDRDITAQCVNHMGQTGNAYYVVLNDFDAGSVAGVKVYDAQLPPRYGISKIQVLKAMELIPTGKAGLGLLTLYPLEALREIHRRNVELLEQKAKLEYVIDQNQNPGKLLWEVGSYCIEGTAVWATNDPGNPDKLPDTQPDSSTIHHDFEVFPPFENVEVEVGGKKVRLQPFEDYVRRMTPGAGERPFYLRQCPAVAFHCNYVNWMLKKSARRLAMVLVDSNGEPSKYYQVAVDFPEIQPKMKAEFKKVLDGALTYNFENIEEYENEVGSAIPGLEADKIAAASGKRGRARSKKETMAGQEIRAHFLSRDTLLENAGEFLRRSRARGDKKASHAAANLAKILKKDFPEKAHGVMVLEKEDILVIGWITLIPKVMEYRYDNRDLDLDLSHLKLSDCLVQNQPQTLNASERGLFKPVLPEDGIWWGPTPGNGYQAKFYCLGKDEDLQSHMDNNPEVFSVSFTTSLFTDPTGLAQLFENCKVREVNTEKALCHTILNQTNSQFAPPTFSHPADQAIAFHLGMDLFRELRNAPAVDPNGKTPREVEEEHQKLYEDKTTLIRQRRQQESLALDDILGQLNLCQEPPSPDRVLATWFRTEEEADGALGTMGVYVELPEPLDWQRAGIRVSAFQVKIPGEAQELDMLNLPAGNPHYEVTFHWFRSLDGTKVLFLPKLLRRAIHNPMAVGMGGKVVKVSPRREAEAAKKTSAAMAVEEPAPAGPSAVALGPRVRLSDIAIVSTMGVRDAKSIATVQGLYGSTTWENVSNYEVTALEMDFYYFPDNFENQWANYRAIPRLTYMAEGFREEQLGEATGKIGTLTLAKTILFLEGWSVGLRPPFFADIRNVFKGRMGR